MSTQTLRGLQNLIRRSHSDRLYQEVGKALLCNRSALVRAGPVDKQLIVPPDVLRAAHVGATRTGHSMGARSYPGEAVKKARSMRKHDLGLGFKIILASPMKKCSYGRLANLK